MQHVCYAIGLECNYELQNVTKICVTKNVQISNVIYDVHC